MKPRAAALAALLALAGAGAVRAQYRPGPQPRSMPMPPPQHATLSPAREPDAPSPQPETPPQAGPQGGDAHPADPLQPANARTSASCPPGASCAKANALVVPVRAQSGSANLVQQGAVPASAVSGPNSLSVPSPSAGLTPPAQSPLPFQHPLPPGQIRITIRAISAAHDTHDLEIDGRLLPIGRELRAISNQFAYRTYRLLDAQTFDLDFRSIAQMELPGKRAVEIEPRQFGPDGRVQVHLELLGRHPDHTASMRTDYSIGRGSTIFVAGFRADDAPDGGTLFLAITQDEQ